MLIANECLDSRLRSDILGVLCKLDLEKADDNVHWNFYIYICFGNVVLVLDGGWFLSQLKRVETERPFVPSFIHHHYGGAWFLSQLKRVETERPFVPSFIHHHYGGAYLDARESWKRQLRFKIFSQWLLVSYLSHIFSLQMIPCLFVGQIQSKFGI